MVTAERESCIGAWCSVVCLYVVASAPVQAQQGHGVDRVPGDFATLQEAIDLGSAPTIQVASGEYAGAVVDREVALVCKGQCMITSGVPVSSVQAGFVLAPGSDGSVIRGFDFVDIDLGVYASCETLGAAPDGVSVVRNAFVNTAQGVTVNGYGCDGGDDWAIERNRFHDLRSDISECGGGLGVYLIGVDGGLVSRNVLRGEIAAPPCGPLFTTAGIYLSGSSDVRIERNDFELGDGGHPFKVDVGLFPEDGANTSIVIANNDARGSAAPFEGVNFLSIDSIDVTATCNSGTTLLEHTGSEGTSERYTEAGCRRVPAP
jgi:nitrous oxidase accessory protein NosD